MNEWKSPRDLGKIIKSQCHLPMRAIIMLATRTPCVPIFIHTEVLILGSLEYIVGLYTQRVAVMVFDFENFKYNTV